MLKNDKNELLGVRKYGEKDSRVNHVLRSGMRNHLIYFNPFFPFSYRFPINVTIEVLLNPFKYPLNSFSARRFSKT